MEQVKLAVIGAGPAGIATAVEAKEANIAPVVVLEKKSHICDTIENLYRAGKRVDPVHRKVKVEPIGKLSFDTETKEAFLKRMKDVVRENDLDYSIPHCQARKGSIMAAFNSGKKVVNGILARYGDLLKK